MWFLGGVIPACMIIYGWSVEKRVGGIALPVIMMFLQGVAQLFCFPSLNAYCLDVMQGRSAEVVGMFTLPLSFQHSILMMTSWQLLHALHVRSRRIGCCSSSCSSYWRWLVLDDQRVLPCLWCGSYVCHCTVRQELARGYRREEDGEEGGRESCVSIEASASRKALEYWRFPHSKQGCSEPLFNEAQKVNERFRRIHLALDTHIIQNQNQTPCTQM